MCELIAKLVCDEMNIRRCIKKSIAVQMFLFIENYLSEVAALPGVECKGRRYIGGYWPESIWITINYDLSRGGHY